jgi:hypothetical protein
MTYWVPRFCSRNIQQVVDQQLVSTVVQLEFVPCWQAYNAQTEYLALRELRMPQVFQ